MFDYAGATNPATTIGGLLTASYHGGLWDVGQFRDTTSDGDGHDARLGRRRCVEPSEGDGHVRRRFQLGRRGGRSRSNDLDGERLQWHDLGQGDANYDGVVNGLDRDLWFSHVGMSPVGAMMPAASVTAVPEPTTLALLAAGLLGLCGLRLEKAKIAFQLRKEEGILSKHKQPLV